MDSFTKKKIIERLFENCSVCMFCKKRGCAHGSNRTLPQTLDRDSVLKAINAGEYFFKEDAPNVELTGSPASGESV